MITERRKDKIKTKAKKVYKMLFLPSDYINDPKNKKIYY